MEEKNNRAIDKSEADLIFTVWIKKKTKLRVLHYSLMKNIIPICIMLPHSFNIFELP